MCVQESLRDYVKTSNSVRIPIRGDSLDKLFYEVILRLPALPITPPSYKIESILRRTSILLTNYDSRYSMRFDILRVTDQGLKLHEFTEKEKGQISTTIVTSHNLPNLI